MKIPKLIVSDIDGVMAIDGNIVATVAEELKRLMQSGTLCTVATGRGYYRYLQCAAGKFTPNFPVIVENGGRICSPEGQTLHAVPVSNETCAKVEHLMTPPFVHGMGFIQLADNRYVNLEYTPKPDAENVFLPQAQVAAEYESLPEFLHHLRTSRCCVLAFLPPPGMGMQFPDDVNWTRNDHNYMVMEKGVSKASALRHLCTLHNIPLDQVLIAGNDYNDQELFRLPVAWRIAVGDGCKEIQALATHTVDTPYAFGNFLTHFVD